MAIRLELNEKDRQEVTLWGAAGPWIKLMEDHGFPIGQHMQRVGALLFKLNRVLGLCGGESQMGCRR